VNSNSHDFSWHEDYVFIAACDVYKAHLDAVVQTMGGKVDAYADYRSILERKDTCPPPARRRSPAS
jgi:hypothetical protein